MFDIVKKKWIFFTIAIVLLVVSVASLIFKGFNLDTDFSGGLALTYEIAGDFSTEDVNALVDNSLDDGRRASSIQRAGSEVIIKIGYDNDMTDEERAQFSETVRSEVTAALEERYGAPVVDSAAAATAAPESENAAATAAPEGDGTVATAVPEGEGAVATAVPEGEGAVATAAPESTGANASADASAALTSGVRLKSLDDISPSSGQELARSALWMSLLACAGILIYVTIRFEFTSGCVAIIALIHDVVVLLGIYSLFGISVDINFIAAVLTVLGYSINNTIVIMDRIRENTRHSRKESYAEIANTSIWQTMTRSINTTVTTLLTIGMVYIIGVTSIREFSMPIIIGIVIGFCSSVFLTGPMWATWRDSAVKAKSTAGGKKK